MLIFDFLKLFNESLVEVAHAISVFLPIASEKALQIVHSTHDLLLVFTRGLFAEEERVVLHIHQVNVAFTTGKGALESHSVQYLLSLLRRDNVRVVEGVGSSTIHHTVGTVLAVPRTLHTLAADEAFAIDALLGIQSEHLASLTDDSVNVDRLFFGYDQLCRV